MRSYIFTPKERAVVKAYLRGERISGKILRQILYRVRLFSGLAEDIELYTMLVRKAMTANPT